MKTKKHLLNAGKILYLTKINTYEKTLVPNCFIRRLKHGKL